MKKTIILASASQIRRQLLTNANLAHRYQTANVDEKAILEESEGQNLTARETALSIANAKAAAVSTQTPDTLVIGCDQVLEIDGQLLSKPVDRKQALEHLCLLSGQTHQLSSAATVYENQMPVWQYVETVDLEMREFSSQDLKHYLDRNWENVRHCVGCYMLEKEGAWLFSKIIGDYFSVLGLPLVQLLGYLSSRGVSPE